MSSRQHQPGQDRPGGGPLIQTALFILSGGAVYLVSRGNLLWGNALGCLSQPFWMWSSYKARQWGIFLLSIWYLFAWISGFWLALSEMSAK